MPNDERQRRAQALQTLQGRPRQAQLRRRRAGRGATCPRAAATRRRPGPGRTPGRPGAFRCASTGGTGRRRPDRKGKKAAARRRRHGAQSRRRFRWWYVPVGLLVAFVIAGVVVTVLAWPGYKKFDRAVDKSNKRIDKKTRAELTPDDGWIWRNGTTLLLLRRRQQGRRAGPLGHDHADALQPRDAHHQPALDPARHARPPPQRHLRQDQHGDVLGRPVHGHHRPSSSTSAST